MNNDTVTISAEALRRLEVEAAFGRGEKIQGTLRRASGKQWGPVSHPLWDWGACDYRVAPPKPDAPRQRTHAELLAQIEELIAELKAEQP